MRKPSTLILATAAVVGATALAVPAAALATTSDLQIRVHAAPTFPKATGTAQYQSQPGQREFQVELGHLKALAGHSILIQVNGVNIGRAKVSSLGSAHLTRNTELGQNVPQIAPGSTVSIVTGASQALVASGTF